MLPDKNKPLPTGKISDVSAGEDVSGNINGLAGKSTTAAPPPKGTVKILKEGLTIDEGVAASKTLGDLLDAWRRKFDGWIK
jgi:hypothetical protein